MEQKRKSDANKEISKDSQIRQDVHKMIRDMLSKEKTKVEIITFLVNKYPDTYLNKYFGQWVDYHIKKRDYTLKNDEIEI